MVILIYMNGLCITIDRPMLKIPRRILQDNSKCRCLGHNLQKISATRNHWFTCIYCKHLALIDNYLDDMLFTDPMMVNHGNEWYNKELLLEGYYNYILSTI